MAEMCLTLVKSRETPYLLSWSLIFPPGSAIAPIPLSHASSTASFQAVIHTPKQQESKLLAAPMNLCHYTCIGQKTSNLCYHYGIALDILNTKPRKFGIRKFTFSRSLNRDRAETDRLPELCRQSLDITSRHQLV